MYRLPNQLFWSAVPSRVGAAIAIKTASAPNVTPRPERGRAEAPTISAVNPPTQSVPRTKV